MTRNPRDHRVWTNMELEADPQGYRAAREALREDRAAEEKKRQEEDDRKRFTEAFVAAGGSEKDAEAAFKAHRNEQAVEATKRADQQAVARQNKASGEAVIELGDEDMKLIHEVAAKRYEHGESMREEHATPEENALDELRKTVWEELSEPARRVFGEAVGAAYAHHLVHNVSYQPEEYQEAMQRMRDALDESTERDMELLKSVWIAQLRAAVSIDPDDERPAGHKVDRSDLHYFYRMASGMIEDSLDRKRYDIPANIPAN